MGLLRALSGFASALHLLSSEGSHNAIYPGTPDMHPRILIWGTPDFAYKLQGLACSMTGLACSRPSRCKGKRAALPNRASGACTSTCTYTYTCACRCLLGRGIGLFAIPCVYVRIHMHMRVRIGPRRALSSSVGCARVRVRIQLCRPLKLCSVRLILSKCDALLRPWGEGGARPTCHGAPCRSAGDCGTLRRF